MNDERWRVISQLYEEAARLAPVDRAPYLRKACGDDEALRAEIESLLLDDTRVDALLESKGSHTTLIGQRIGGYEIRSLLGVGGMGEVYRARDPKLDRDVAIKVLPAALASDSERLARFQREARLLASLNHPHIGGIYGFEDASGVPALVLELVEGDTLAERLEKAPMSVSEALHIARQVADALETAHEKGIVHRDLKPANIKITPIGAVKVLDFGLAKAASGNDSGPDLTQSPNATADGTRQGMVLGTPAYMSPEQARGHAVDKRTDIWAFGCVLYEMLSGRIAFERKTVSDTIAAIIEREPDWGTLPADVPTPIVTLLRSCLEKERRSRVADIGAASFVLNHAAELIERVEVPAASVRLNAVTQLPRWRRATRIAAALTMGALLAGAGTWLLLPHRVPPSVVRTTITTSGSTALALHGVDRDIAITPDGSRVVYRGNNQLLVRALNQLEPTVLGGLGAPRGVFVSPDGQWVGFFDQTTMKKVAIAGGPPVTVCTIEGVARGATWSEDGTIIFATNAPAIGLHRVSATVGEPTALTKPDGMRGEADHLWPEFLPGGKAVLFTITRVGGSIEDAQVAVLDLQTGTSKILIRGGSHAHFLPPGHLVYGVAGTLRAVAFDLGELETLGTPVPVLKGVVTTAQGAADVAESTNGSLIYVPRGTGQQTVVSVDREGRASKLPGLSLDAYRDVRVSPDGKQLALATQADVWTYDFVRATLSRLTTDPAPDTRPLWTPDGQRIVFTSTRSGFFEMFWRRADDTGSDERLLSRAKDLADLRASGWSADGKQLLFTEMFPNVRCAIGQLAIEQPLDVKVLVRDESCSDWATLSPDGLWMAYESNVSGRQEIYMQRYPDLGNRQKISTNGGTRPVWSRDGRELFFASLDGRQMFGLTVPPGTTPGAGRPKVLFEFAMLVPTGGTWPYDIAPNGQFLIIRGARTDAGGNTASDMIVVLNWQEELKQRCQRADQLSKPDESRRHRCENGARASGERSIASGAVADRGVTLKGVTSAGGSSRGSTTRPLGSRRSIALRICAGPAVATRRCEPRSNRCCATPV